MPHYILATTVTGTNTFFMASGVLAASISIDFSRTPGVPILAAAAFPVFATLLVLFFGEIIPKVYARKNYEKVCGAGIRALVAAAAPIAPVSKVLLKVTEGLLRLTGFHAFNESAFITREELREILDSGPPGELTGKERTMLANVLSFGGRKIKEVMVPRSEIFAVNYESGLKQIIPQAVSSRFSRVPVYKKNFDYVVGIIYVRDLVVAHGDTSLYVINDLLRPAFFVPENAPVSTVLREFMTGRHHMAVVVDEYGITRGLVTVEDIVEDIVGEIYDESDIREKTIMEMPDGWLIKANESVAAVNSELRIGIPESPAYTTVAGWTLSLFGKIPSPGEKTGWNGFTVEVTEADGRKVIAVRIYHPLNNH
jgi:CBS domain containing-hemolysin-like protein